LIFSVIVDKFHHMSYAVEAASRKKKEKKALQEKKEE
jgi:hypothetical protein